MHRKLISTASLLVAALLLSSSQAHNKDEWKSRTIYQLLTDRFWRDDGNTQPCDDIHKYCGGTFKGIQDKLDYIKGMGFDAIWISPIPENYGNDYHGYGALDWYKVNPHFGDEQALKDMINAAHEKGIWVMLDVVANHVAWIDTQYNLVNPFNQPTHYHTKCQINNWDDQNEVEYCRLANLPDLDQDNQFVRSTLLNWVKDTVQKFNFDGIRIDTVPHVKKDFWKEYAQSAGVFQIGEVLKGDVGYVSYYTHDGLDATMNYPLYFSLRNVFNYKHSMYEIRNVFNQEKNAFADVDALGVFIDNHDNPRFLSISPSMPLFKTALTFALFSQGIPIVYYGSEQGFNGGNDPANREPLWTAMNTASPLYTFVQTLVSVRKSHQVWNFPHIERWCDDTFYAFTRGDVLIAVTNQD
jgi:alpha-amylase